METKPLFWDVLEGRRSIRKYKPDPVPTEFIEKILQAGVQAPNARNRQSWRFVVLTAFDSIEGLADTLNLNFRRDMLAAGKPAAEVDQMVVDRKARICGGKAIVVMFVDTADLNSYSPADPASGDYLMAVQSVALAGGQMLLAAQALGLGGLWMGGPVFSQQKLIDFLGVPPNWLAQGMLLFGFADEAPEKKARKPMGEIVRYFSDLE
jgi:nitroreductase